MPRFNLLRASRWATWTKSSAGLLALVGGSALLTLSLETAQCSPEHASSSPPPFVVTQHTHTPLQSLFSEDAQRVHINFTLADEVGTRVLLCWVDDQAALHHFYELKPGESHTEFSYTGHAFVLFRSRDKQPRPVTTADIPVTDVLCSFLAVAPSPEGFMLRVALSVTRPSSFPEPPTTLVSRSECPLEPEACNVLATCSVVPIPDQELRIVVDSPETCDNMLPPADTDWIVEYRYLCPPLPCGDAFKANQETIYVWGDLDFDSYGGQAKQHSITDYQMNQIVPQVMTGSVLVANDQSYRPKWAVFDHWVMQAQYYWQTEVGEEHGSRAQCGPYYRVAPGAEITSTIAYDAQAGSICVSISDDSGHCSRLLLDRPFPNTDQFASWREFFSAAQTASNTHGVCARPQLNVEYKGDVSIRTLKSLCPFVVTHISYPGESQDASAWRATLYCPRVGYCLALHSPDLHQTSDTPAPTTTAEKSAQLDANVTPRNAIPCCLSVCDAVRGVRVQGK